MQAALFESTLPVRPTMGDLLPQYRDHLLASGKSAHTASSYLRIVRRLASFCGSGRKLETCSTQTLESFVSRVRQGTQSPKTVELVVSAVKHFSAWAFEAKHSAINPAAALIFPRAPIKLPDLPRLREIEALLRKASNSPEDLLLILLLTEGGLKREEILALTPDHIDGNDPLRIPIRVPARQAHKIRTVYLPREYRVSAMDWVIAKGSEQPLFPRDGSWISHRVDALGKAAGIKRDITPASLRHFCAVRMLKAGRTIQEVHEYLGLAPPKDCPIPRDTYQALAKLPL